MFCRSTGSSLSKKARIPTPKVFSLFNGQSRQSRALALAHRAVKETRSNEEAIARVFALTSSRPTAPEETRRCLAHWSDIEALLSNEKPPFGLRRDAIEGNTGEKFSFNEKRHPGA